MAKIYDKALTFKKQLEAMDEATLKLISAEYNRTLAKLKKQFIAMAERAQEYTAEHQTPTPYELGRLKEIKKAIEAVEAEMNRLHLDSADKISICQRAYINAVPNHYEKLINGLADEYGAEDVHFSKVNTEAFNKLVGFTSDGSPLADVLNKHSALNKESIISILRHGCLVGENPKATARKMTKAGYSDASHALLVARTESMRVAQEVGNENFKKNGVEYIQWVSGETPYTCAACWAMSGKVFETGKQPHDHPNGRCVFNPYIPELAELDPDLYKHDPEENFAKLSEEEQKAVLGPKRFEMWKNGELNLTDLADTTDSDDYGESIKIRSLGDLAGGSGSGGGSKNLTNASVKSYNKNEADKFFKAPADKRDEADPIRAYLGSAIETEPEIVASIKSELKKYKVDFVVDDNIAYGPKTLANPATMSLKDSDSICAWLHEYQHFLDDKSSAWQGLRIIQDLEPYWKFEYNGYMAEIRYLKKINRNDLVPLILNLARKAKKEMYKEYGREYKTKK